MLKNKLYTFTSLEEQEKGNYLAEVTLNPNHPIFDGHFPTQPVLPGVCLLEMLKEMLGEIKGKPLRMKNAATIKYLKLVDPTEEPVLKFEIQITEESGELKVSASSFLKDSSPNFKMKGIFA